MHRLFELSPRDSDRRTIRLKWAWLMLVLAAPAVLAARYNIAEYAYDAAAAHVYRGVVFSQAISDGTLYPRWVQFLHGGLGSPLFTFQAPSAYYLLHLLSLLGLSHHVGWQLLIGVGLLFGFTGAYLLAHLLVAKQWPAVAAAVAYLYAPYILKNAYERGSVEAFSVLVYPWVLWGFLWLARRPLPARFVVATLLWAGCISLHVLGPLMLAPVAIVVCLLASWRYKTWYPLGAFICGVLLTAVIWMPILAEQRYVQVEQDFLAYKASPARNSIPVDALLALPDLYDIMRGNNSVGDRVGLPQFALLVLAVPAFLWTLSRRQWHFAVVLGFTAIVGLGIFWLLTGASDSVWRMLDPLLGRLQYRSRLMGVQALAASVALAALLTLLPSRAQRWAAGGAISLMILVSFSPLYVFLQHRYAVFDAPQTLADVRAAEVRQGLSALTSFGEFLPRWRTAGLGAALLNDIGPDHDSEARPFMGSISGVSVTSAQVQSSAWDLVFSTERPTTLTLALLYYPRWRALIDGIPASLRPQLGTGYAQIDAPAGEHRLTLRYARTPTEIAGTALTGLMALTLSLLAVRNLVSARRRARVFSGQERPLGDGVNDMSLPLWLPLLLTVLLLFKVGVIDRSTTWFRCVTTLSSVCGATATTEIAFAGAPDLRGNRLFTPHLRVGDTLRLNLYWQGIENAKGPIQSFVHVRNSRQGGPLNPETENEIWAQDEHVTPGNLLSTDFVSEKIYLDEFRIRLPENMPPGEYYLEVGWFDPATGEQIEPVPDTVKPPYRILWRSVLLSNLVVK